MAKDAKTIREELARPFAPEDLEWRIQVTSKDKTSGLAIPYVTNRAIQDRLDEVVGPENWYNDYKPWHGNGKKDAQICGISIYFEGKGFITKWDGAEDSDIEPIKGGLSDSMKRSAVQWGIGRVLYKMTKPLWVKIEQKGNSYVICDTERPKLNAAYLELLDKLHQLPTSPGAAQAQLSYKRDGQAGQQAQNTAPQQPSQQPRQVQQPLPFTTRQVCQYVVLSVSNQQDMSGRRWSAPFCKTQRARRQRSTHRAVIPCSCPVRSSMTRRSRCGNRETSHFTRWMATRSCSRQRKEDEWKKSKAFTSAA